MKKRLLVLAMAICVLAPMTLSARAFDFNLGATAQFQKDVTDSEFDAGSIIDINNYRFGAETRFNFLLLEVSDTLLLGSTDVSGSTGVEFTNHIAAGIYTDIADVVRLGLGAGPEFGIKFTGDGIYDSQDADFEITSIFMKSNFTYKAHADFLIGKKLTLSATYTLPTTFNLDSFDLTKLIPTGSDWQNGRVGISLLLF